MATVAQHQTYWERAKEAGFDLSWLNQLEENVVGAEVEDVSDNLTGRVAGSIPRPGVAKYGAYPFRTKKEVWGYNLRKLYEEFVSRQWSSATDIPWDTLEELPDDIEAAECQLATFFAQVEFVAADVPGRFIATMSPDYQEVRMALLGQVMDESRHLEVFRKRALANGGGLMRMIDSVTDVVGGSTDSAREYTELSTRLHIVGEGNVLTLFRLGELMAYNEAEKTIYRRCAWKRCTRTWTRLRTASLRAPGERTLRLGTCSQAKLWPFCWVGARTRPMKVRKSSWPYVRSR